MKKIINKFTKLLPIVLIGIFLNNGVCYASNSSIIENESPVLINDLDINTNSEIITKNNTIQSGGSLDKAEHYVENKLFDVVGFLQSFIKPLTYVTFIISTIMVLFGVVTDSKSKFKGFLGMAFSIFVYISVVFAPQIVDYLSSWLSVM